jgi:hypothetical protein
MGQRAAPSRGCALRIEPEIWNGRKRRALVKVPRRCRIRSDKKVPGRVGLGRPPQEPTRQGGFISDGVVKRHCCIYDIAETRSEGVISHKQWVPAGIHSLCWPHVGRAAGSDRIAKATQLRREQQFASHHSATPEISSQDLAVALNVDRCDDAYFPSEWCREVSACVTHGLRRGALCLFYLYESPAPEAFFPDRR